MKRWSWLAVAAMLLASTTIASCGSSSKGASHPSATVATTTLAKVGTTTALAAVKFATTTGPPPAGAIEEVMTGVSYSRPSVSAKAGTVVFYLVNRDPNSDADQPHDMVVTSAASIDPIARSDHIEPGKSEVLTIENLPPGTYPFHCSVDGHAMSGMKGTLTVTA